MKNRFFFPFWIFLISSHLWFSEHSKANVLCNGSLGASTLEDVKVPNGLTCRLTGTRIKGNLTIGSNATLLASEIKVSGNIEARNAARIEIAFFSVVDGNILIQRSRNANISASKIDGNVRLDSNLGAVSARGNEIDGNLEIFRNSGGVLLRNNRIEGNLICERNQPSPIGNDNTVDGDKEKQCSRL